MSPRSGSRAERLIAAEQASADVLNRAQNVLDVLDNVVDDEQAAAVMMEAESKFRASASFSDVPITQEDPITVTPADPPPGPSPQPMPMGVALDFAAAARRAVSQQEDGMSAQAETEQRELAAQRAPQLQPPRADPRADSTVDPRVDPRADLATVEALDALTSASDIAALRRALLQALPLAGSSPEIAAALSVARSRLKQLQAERATAAETNGLTEAGKQKPGTADPPAATAMSAAAGTTQAATVAAAPLLVSSAPTVPTPAAVPTSAAPPAVPAAVCEDEAREMQEAYRPKALYTHALLKSATSEFSPDCILGSGGSGSVYKGTLRSGTPVAVKVFAQQLSWDDDASRAQWRTEVELLSTLAHPNIVQLLGCCSDGPQLCLVYAYMEGGSLDR